MQLLQNAELRFIWYELMNDQARTLMLRSLALVLA